MSSGTDFFGGTKAPARHVPADVEREIEARAGEAGFRDRGGLKPPPKRKRGTAEQLHNFTMRLAHGDAEAFIRYCERERLSYREAFAQMVRLLPKSGDS